MPIEWDVPDGTATASGTDEEELPERDAPLERLLTRVPRPVWSGAALLGAAALLASLVSTPSTAPPLSGPDTRATTGPVATPSIAPRLIIEPGNEDVAVVRQLAYEPGPLPVYIRSSTQESGCRVPPRGSSPSERIRTVVHQAFPRFHSEEVGFTLDPSSALCVLQLRSRNYNGSVLVVDVIAPRRAQHRRLDVSVRTGTQVSTDGWDQTRFVIAVIDGWRVTIGATGQPGTLPSRDELRALALHPGLRW